MERDNYYLLLELSVDPPENNREAIEAAIRKKQAEWSRLRNHPTKAMQAKKNIGMIPQMRKVMLDDDLRAEEAEAARRQLGRQAADRFAELDRHLALWMSKGYITQEEIFKLAKVHDFDEKEIRQRVKAQEKERFAQLDEHIALRANKGFVTEDEIARLAKMHNLSADVIRKRVTVPIRKATTGDAKKVRPLDPSIAKVIGDNLKVVGQTSLYQFLDLPASVSLEDLQRRARKVDADLRKIGRKDARVTAGSVLAGHCITLFKSAEARQAYDATLARGQLAQLDSDIDVAGMDGVVRAEYFQTLVKTAMTYGMDEEEAAEYIRAYCAKRKWRVETGPAAPTARLPQWTRYAAAGLAVLLLAGGVWMFQRSRVKARYDRTLKQVAAAEPLESKLDLLQAYVKAHPEGRYADRARTRQAAVRQAIAERDFQSVEAQAKPHLDGQRFEQALVVYEAYLATDPPEAYVPKVKQLIAKARTRMDERDFAALDDLVGTDAYTRMSAYWAYLQKFPKGRHVKAVRGLIDEMREEYYLVIEKDLAACEARRDWDACIQLCKSFINIYQDDTRAVALLGRHDTYQKKQYGRKVLGSLREKAAAAGTDVAAAQQVYRDYLQAYPDSVIRADIQREIARLEQQGVEMARQGQVERLRGIVRQAATRFSEAPAGVVRDDRSGLFWTLADSSLTVGECLTFEAAQDRVARLDTGGYGDWRLPTIQELTVLHAGPTPYPVLTPGWFWSATTYKRYASGWRTMVDTVNADTGGLLNTEQRDAQDCGRVRAVRP